MSKYMSEYNAASFIEHLSNKGLVSKQGLTDFIIAQQHKKELPLYVRIVVGVGAFITSICFIVFLVFSELIDSDISFIVWGLLFIAGAIGLQKLTGNNNTIKHKHSFVMQSSFAFITTGKILFIIGMNDILDSDWGISLALFIVTLATYNIYRMSIDRFLSSFALLFSILANIWDGDILGSRELWLNGFFLFQFVGAAILLTHNKIPRDYTPLSYALVFSLCASVLFLAAHAKFEYLRHAKLINPIFITIVLVAGLIALFVWAAGTAEYLKTQPFILASIGAVLLGLISAPGVLLTIALMILGYAKHEKPFIIIGLLLIPVFLFLYYYNLDVSLLKKSGILVGSGIALLVGRFYVRYKGWDTRGASCVEK